MELIPYESHFRLLIEIKEGVDDMDMASGIPLWEQIGLVPENYTKMAVTELSLSVRVVNAFKQNSINTVSDLLKLKPGQTTFDLRRLMRPIVVIPEAMPVPKALRLMQQRHVQMVLVADEYGGTAGLITMEDLVEEIVGDIQDEHEAQEPPDVLQLPDGRIEFDGMVLLDDVAEQLPIVFDDPEEDTIGGYVFGLLGRKPEIGDAVEISGYSFKVLRTEGFRVVRVLAAKLPQEQEQKEEQQDE